MALIFFCLGGSAVVVWNCLFYRTSTSALPDFLYGFFGRHWLCFTQPMSSTLVSTCPLLDQCSVCFITACFVLRVALYISALFGLQTCIRWSIPATRLALPISCLLFGGFGDGLKVCHCYPRVVHGPGGQWSV